jgi:PEP-CTERM motif
MNNRWLRAGLAASCCFQLASLSRAALLIPTNQNGGADAEVREEETGTPTPIYPGVNRGSNFELATRILDSTNGGTSDRTSASYLKFDISGITAADLATHPYAGVRLRVGAPNINASRQTAPSPADPSVTVKMQFVLRGLTNFALNNWSESTLTYYNAPGITPDAAPFPVDPGEYDFNSDMPELGRFPLPMVGAQNHLAVGSLVRYGEAAGGPLYQLIAQAKAAGQNYITLVVHDGLNGFQANLRSGVTGEAPGTTPTSMLNFNYLFIPKEILTIDNANNGSGAQPNNLNDTAYDPDGAGPIAAGPSPFLHASNADGTFSPTLVLSDSFVPEPGTIGLAGLALVAAAAVSRRK